MSQILIGYVSNAGSTREIADVMAAELKKGGHEVNIDLLTNNPNLSACDTVIIGAPMILGWHSDAQKFLKKYNAILKTKRVAYFACALKLTRNPAAQTGGIDLAMDPSLAVDPARPGKIGLEEGFTTVDHYLNPMLSAAPEVRPISIAFFNGKLDYSRLPLWQKFFVRFIVKAAPGDFRNWDFVTSWTNSLKEKLAAAQ